MPDHKPENLFESAKTLLTEGLLSSQFESGIKKIMDSIKLLSECVEMYPDNPDILLLRASGFIAVKDLKNARDDYHRVQKLNVQNAKILDKLGVGFLLVGNYNDAMKCFDKAVQMNDCKNDRELYFSV